MARVATIIVCEVLNMMNTSILKQAKFHKELRQIDVLGAMYKYCCLELGCCNLRKDRLTSR